VYHSAALISFDPKRRPTTKTNIEGTANIVNFVPCQRSKKLCYINSTTLGDLASNETIITEEIRWNQKNHQLSDYAISKYGAEMEIWRVKEEVRCNNCKSRIMWSRIPRKQPFKEVAWITVLHPGERSIRDG
jgi:nucleoside-diphosphate-sugar epimerase